jgi:hypothetical protein
LSQNFNQGLVLCLFALMPLTSLHHFLFCDLSFSVQHPLAGVFAFTSSFFAHGNITFDLHPLFQEYNYGLKQGLGVQYVIHHLIPIHNLWASLKKMTKCSLYQIQRSKQAGKQTKHKMT